MWEKRAGNWSQRGESRSQESNQKEVERPELTIKENIIQLGLEDGPIAFAGVSFCGIQPILSKDA
jgi:hypothetical protein